MKYGWILMSLLVGCSVGSTAFAEKQVIPDANGGIWIIDPDKLDPLDPNMFITVPVTYCKAGDLPECVTTFVGNFDDVKTLRQHMVDEVQKAIEISEWWEAHGKVDEEKIEEAMQKLDKW